MTRSPDPGPVSVRVRESRTVRGCASGAPTALTDGVKGLQRAVAEELERARVAGRDVAGLAVDKHGHRVLVHRTPTGDLKVIKRVKPFRWSSPASA